MVRAAPRSSRRLLWENTKGSNVSCCNLSKPLQGPVTAKGNSNNNKKNNNNNNNNKKKKKKRKKKKKKEEKEKEEEEEEEEQEQREEEQETARNNMKEACPLLSPGNCNSFS